MQILAYAVSFVSVLVALYLILAAPCLRRKGMSARLIAHRGLFDPQKGVPENALGAFKAACRAGYAIELDVQITLDGIAVVFHDDDLGRMCGVDGDIREMSFAELSALRLSGTDEHIPTFAEVLALVGGRVPLLVELKHNPRRTALVCAALDALSGYQGEFVIESFDPMVLRELKKRDREVPRGQLVGRKSGVLSLLMFNCFSRPDFVAFEAGMARSWVIWVQRNLFRTPLAVWTLKSYEQLEKQKNDAQMLIFDSFRP